MNISQIINLILENLEADCSEWEDEDGKHLDKWVETDKVGDVLFWEADLTVGKIYKILEVVKDRVEINWTRSHEEEGISDDIEYDLDSEAEEMIKEILNT